MNGGGVGDARLAHPDEGYRPAGRAYERGPSGDPFPPPPTLCALWGMRSRQASEPEWTRLGGGGSAVHERSPRSVRKSLSPAAPRVPLGNRTEQAPRSGRGAPFFS